MLSIWIFALNWIVFESYALDGGFRVSLEYFQLTYANDKYFEGSAITVPVSNKTNKLRATGLLRYKPTDDLELDVTVLRVLRKNKEYLFTRVKRRIKSLLFFTMIPQTEDLLEHFSPALTWPPLPNVTYTLRDWWLPNSQIPTEVPIAVPTGRFKTLGTILYPNGTILTTAEAMVNVIHSYEDFD